MINLDIIPIPDGSLHVREIGEEIIIMNEEGDVIHSLDETAAFIWQNINGKSTLKNILDNLCDEYDVSREIAKSDLIKFITELSEKGILKTMRDHNA